MMGVIKEIFNTLNGAVLELPALEVTALIILLTCCLVFRFTRTGLIAAYIFAYRWGWVFFSEQPHEMLMGYLIFGCVVGILTVIGMLQTPS